MRYVRRFAWRALVVLGLMTPPVGVVIATGLLGQAGHDLLAVVTFFMGIALCVALFITLIERDHERWQRRMWPRDP